MLKQAWSFSFWLFLLTFPISRLLSNHVASTTGISKLRHGPDLTSQSIHTQHNTAVKKSYASAPQIVHVQSLKVLCPTATFPRKSGWGTFWGWHEVATAAWHEALQRLSTTNNVCRVEDLPLPWREWILHTAWTTFWKLLLYTTKLHFFLSPHSASCSDHLLPWPLQFFPLWTFIISPQLPHLHPAVCFLPCCPFCLELLPRSPAGCLLS